MRGPMRRRPVAWTMATLGSALSGFLGCFLGGGSTAQASPQEVIGFGYRSIGMGTTGVAAAEGVDAVYGNPALLSASRELTLELGLMGSSFILEAEGPGLVEPLVAYPRFFANTIGGILPLPFGGVLRDRVTIGLGFVTPTDVVVRGRILYPEKPQMLFADRVQSVAVQAALGIDLGYGLRIGGGFMALAALTGSVTVATDASGRIGTVVEDTLVASFAPLAGISYEWSDYRVGLAYRGELVGRFNVVIEAENLGQLEIPPLNISGVAQYDPHMFAVGLAQIQGDTRWALGVSFKLWSAYPGPVEATVRCEDAPEPDAPCAAPQPADLEYIPTVAPRAGVERRFAVSPDAMLALRGGYAFEPSPAPEQEGRTNYFDNHRSLFSIGWGARFEEPLSFGLDGYLQLQWLHDRRHHKQVGQGASVDGRVDTNGFVPGGGVSASVRF
jgi:hypothetical protein